MIWLLLGLLVGVIPIYLFYRFSRSHPEHQRYLYLIVAVGFSFFLVFDIYRFVSDPGPLLFLLTLFLVFVVVQFFRQFVKNQD
ncbi:MAG TPA: hypothetical protein VLS25_05600 [Dehalococcoidia bacterium]|nr:hypothetical protein [Dehalococcoidia bacterium]